MERSFWHPHGTQSGTSPPPVGFCFECPSGASCHGGNSVQSLEGWYCSKARVIRRGLNVTEVDCYRCPQGACAGNNSCNGGREALLCSFCPQGEHWDGEKCQKNNQTSQIMAGVFIGLAFICWMRGVYFGWGHLGHFIKPELTKKFHQVITKYSKPMRKLVSKNFHCAALGAQVLKILLGNLQVQLLPINFLLSLITGFRNTERFKQPNR